MLRILLIILLAGVSACSSTATEVEEPDPFDGAEPVEGGVYADLPDSPPSTTWAPERVLNEGLRYFGTYHRSPVLSRRGDRLFPGDAKLLHYYRNRLDGYGLDGAIDPRLEGLA